MSRLQFSGTPDCLQHIDYRLQLIIQSNIKNSNSRTWEDRWRRAYINTWTSRKMVKTRTKQHAQSKRNIHNKFLVTSENFAWAHMSSIAFFLTSAGTVGSLVNWENVGDFLVASTRSKSSASTFSNALALVAARYKADA